MKRPSILLSCAAGALICLGGIGCEMHPPSQTIEGYSEKNSSDEQAARTPGDANPTPPAHFPPKE